MSTEWAAVAPTLVDRLHMPHHAALDGGDVAAETTRPADSFVHHTDVPSEGAAALSHIITLFALKLWTFVFQPVPHVMLTGDTTIGRQELNIIFFNTHFYRRIEDAGRGLCYLAIILHEVTLF